MHVSESFRSVREGTVLGPSANCSRAGPSGGIVTSVVRAVYGI